MNKDTHGGTFKNLQEMRDFALKKANDIRKPDFESVDYFYHRWTHASGNLQSWNDEEVGSIEVGDLILYEQKDNHHFYRYGMVAKVFYGTVVTSREVFVAYDLGPAIGMSTRGDATVLIPVNHYSPIQFCKNVRDFDWVRANGDTLSLAMRSLNSEIQLGLANKKINELKSLLKR